MCEILIKLNSDKLLIIKINKYIQKKKTLLLAVMTLKINKYQKKINIAMEISIIFSLKINKKNLKQKKYTK